MHFLNTIWKPYPNYLSQDSLNRDERMLSGKLIHFDKEFSKLSILVNGHLIDVNLGKSNKWHDDFLISQNDSDPLSILIPGDVIQIKGSFEKNDNDETINNCLFILLAPNNGLEMGNEKADWKIIDNFSIFLNLTRKYFLEQNLIEVDTPYLVKNPGSEPTLDPFETFFNFGTKTTNLFLPTSPEIHLKKVLSETCRSIFEIKKCFRNGELSSCHQAEFWMIEWYRPFENLTQIQNDIIGLTQYLVKNMNLNIKTETPKNYTISSLFKKYLNFNLTPLTSISDLKRLALENNIYFIESESWNDIFFRIFIEKIEVNFKDLGMFFISNFPPSQRALSRLNPEGWAERFEFYWGEYEIANAFFEVNDPSEQVKIFEQDALEKMRLGKRNVPIDSEFIDCLKSGMPPTSGIALGIERLFMAMFNIDKINKLRRFPIKD